MSTQWQECMHTGEGGNRRPGGIMKIVGHVHTTFGDQVCEISVAEGVRHGHRSVQGTDELPEQPGAFLAASGGNGGIQVSEQTGQRRTHGGEVTRAPQRHTRVDLSDQITHRAG
jgi:hypothetical protein